MWLYAVLTVLAIAAVFVVLRMRSVASRSGAQSSAFRSRLRHSAPTIEELTAERDTLIAERDAAEARGDKSEVEELTLQIRTKEHWIQKAKRGEDRWREYYEKTSGKILDEWGKTGSK